MSNNGTPPRRRHDALVTLIVDIVLPAGSYYLFRGFGVDSYLSLILAAALPAAAAVVRLVWRRELDRLAVYVTTVMLLSLAVSLLASSPRALLAREAWLTGFTGLWFFASAWTRRPLAFLYTRPMLERRTGPPGVSWDVLWDRLPRFRRLWQVGTVLWGVALVIDSAIRVVMAYSLPVDVVPGLGTALYGGTSLLLIVITNVYYGISGLYNPRSALYDMLTEETGPAEETTTPADEQFVALTTYRRDGSAVTTPVWAAGDDGRLLIYTPVRSGKVRRIRHTARVGIAPCDFDGTPRGPSLTGQARLVPRAERGAVRRALAAKYGVRFHVFATLVMLGRPRRNGGRGVGVEVRLDAEPAGEQRCEHRWLEGDRDRGARS